MYPAGNGRRTTRTVMNYKTNVLIQAGRLSIESFLPELGIDNIRQEIIMGLLRTDRSISSKFFYDKRGSKLFEEITQLEEYYPTRTERSILQDISNTVIGDAQNLDIVELGSGDCSKISILLDAVTENSFESIRYIPVDLSQSAINDATSKLSKTYPGLTIKGLIADFLSQLNLVPDERSRLFCFFGSTIGNFEKEDALDFIRDLGQIMSVGDRLLLGMDMVKSEIILKSAYNDSQDVTDAFNRNILNVVNGIIDSDFDTDDFDHQAFYNDRESRIEMHLVANKDVILSSSFLEKDVHIKKGESIHTENSHKYTLGDIEDFALVAGLQIKKIHSDRDKWFSLVEFVK